MLLAFVSWWSQAGSNRRPPACKAGALPAELWPRKIFLLEEMVGLGRFELPTSPLSGVRSNQLSYRPAVTDIKQANCVDAFTPNSSTFKEVIQPQVPLGLPCYDFTPVMNHTVVSVLPKVRLPTSGTAHSHGVTGGVYKARERIHRGILIRDY